MVVTMALSIYSAVILFGGVSAEILSPAFLLASLAVALWGGKLLLAQKVSWKHSPMHWPVLAFVAYTFFRSLSSPLHYDSRLEFLRVLLYALVYFVCANNFYHSRERAWFLGAIMGLALFESSYAIWQVATNSNVVLHVARYSVYDGRGSGTYICPNHLAGFLEICLGLFVGRVAFYHRTKGSLERGAILKVIILYVALMSLAGILVSFSRAGWMATSVSMLAVVLWGEWRLRTMWPRLAASLLVLVTVLLVAFNVPAVWSRLQQESIADQSGGVRALMWNATLRIIQSSPWLGTGPGTWQWSHQLHRNPKLQGHPEYAHSDVLHAFSDYGIVGGLLVMTFFACFFWHVALIANRKTPSEQRSFAIGGAVGTIAILAHSWLDFNLHIPANAMLLFAVAGFIAAMDDPKSEFPRASLGRISRYLLGCFLIALSVAGSWWVIRDARAVLQHADAVQAKEALRWDVALDSFERAGNLSPDNPAPLAGRGEVYGSQSQWRIGQERVEERRELARKAIEMFDQSLALNPYQTAVILRKASAYQLLQQTDKALETFEQAKSVDPNNALVYYRLGLFYKQIGDDDKSADAFQKAEELEVTGDEVSRANLQEFRPRD